MQNMAQERRNALDAIIQAGIRVGRSIARRPHSPEIVQQPRQIGAIENAKNPSIQPPISVREMDAAFTQGMTQGLQVTKAVEQ